MVALCVGDTIDFKGPGKGRQAFPRNKEALVAEQNGQEMFDIARKALMDMAVFIPGYGDAVANPKKFCHGYGVFQRDLQFFKDDPDYFLELRYETFSNTLTLCLGELQRGLKKLGLQSRTSLTDDEFATVAIAYNPGGYNPAKGLKQGFFDGEKCYGERIFDYLKLSRTVDTGLALAAGRYVVVARGGLKLRGGPGTNFDSEKTLPAGTELNVVEGDSQDPSWGPRGSGSGRSSRWLCLLELPRAGRTAYRRAGGRPRAAVILCRRAGAARETLVALSGRIEAEQRAPVCADPAYASDAQTSSTT